jgi:formate C-acetyltransferase
VQGFFAQGGMQLQVSAIDGDELRAAQADPDAHRHLLVRIGGYSEHFTGLTREMQDAIIARTEHGVG